MYVCIRCMFVCMCVCAHVRKFVCLRECACDVTCICAGGRVDANLCRGKKISELETDI